MPCGIYTVPHGTVPREIPETEHRRSTLDPFGFTHFGVGFGSIAFGVCGH
jgi:hypothetical protein